MPEQQDPSPEVAAAVAAERDRCHAIIGYVVGTGCRPFRAHLAQLAIERGDSFETYKARADKEHR